MSSAPTLITSVQRALHLVDEVGAAGRPLPAKALARRTGLALPTAYHLLATLVHEGYLTRVDHCYALGDRILALSEPGSRAARGARFRPVLREAHETLGAAVLTEARALERRLCAAVDVAVDREEYALGTACVAVAVPSATTTASVAVSVPVARLDREPDLVPALRRAARLIGYGLEDSG